MNETIKADIHIDLEGTRVNLRVAAIIVRGDKVLISQPQGEDWYFLPGGRVKTNESSREAIERELEEELGKSFRVLRPIVCAENFFKLKGIRFHEVCFFYLAEWLGDAKEIQMSTGEEICWFHLQEVEQIDLRPALIRQFVMELPEGFHHVISRESRGSVPCL